MRNNEDIKKPVGRLTCQESTRVEQSIEFHVVDDISQIFGTGFTPSKPTIPYTKTSQKNLISSIKDTRYSPAWFEKFTVLTTCAERSRPFRFRFRRGELLIIMAHPHVNVVSQALERKDSGFSSDITEWNVWLNAQYTPWATVRHGWRREKAGSELWTSRSKGTPSFCVIHRSPWQEIKYVPGGFNLDMGELASWKRLGRFVWCWWRICRRTSHIQSILNKTFIWIFIYLQILHLIPRAIRI